MPCWTGTALQLFRLLDTTAASASSAFDRYRSQLSGAGVEPAGRDAAFLSGVDPLYGPVIVLKKGGCLAGALKFGEKKASHALLESICR